MDDEYPNISEAHQYEEAALAGDGCADGTESDQVEVTKRSTEHLMRMNSAELWDLNRKSIRGSASKSQEVGARDSTGSRRSQSSNDDQVHTRSTTRPSMVGERASQKRATAMGMKPQSEDDKMKAVFVDAAAMKERVRQNLCKPSHKVTDYYKDTGLWQAIAKHYIFENATLGVIAINALWISIDTDNNDAEILLAAHPVFQVAENFFCAFFFMEWLIRFMAFKRKRDGLRDRWFTFDSGMVLLMVLETWVMTLFYTAAGGGSSGGIGNASVLRVARLLRLSRMARMARLLRAMPELMILIKGMVAAMRSVFFTLFLLVIIMYVFAVAFTQLTAGSQVGRLYFKSVVDSMYTLLLYGTLLDDVGMLAGRLGRESLFLGAIFFIFVLLGALTVMNMLIGVLCEVVSAVAATEREEMLVGYVNRKVRKIVEELDQDGGGTISKEEFVQILENMEAVKALQDVGVDVVGLVDFADVIFEEEEDLSFPKFMEVVLQLRGSNNATVKDVVDLRKLVRTETMRTNLLLERLQNLITGQQVELEASIKEAFRKSSASLVADALPLLRSTDDQESMKRLSQQSKASQSSHRDKEAGSYVVKRPKQAHKDMQSISRSSPKLEAAVELDCSPWPANSSGYVELLRSATDESFGSEKVEGIPLESDNSKTVLREAQVTDSSAPPTLSDFRGLWKPFDLTAVRLQASRRGELEKILETPVYWKALKCIPEPLNLSASAIEPIEARLQAAHAALDAAGAPMHESNSARMQGRALLGNFGSGALSDSNAAGHGATFLPTLHEQMARLSKVMVVGLSEVMKIQDELSHNGVHNAKQNGEDNN